MEMGNETHTSWLFTEASSEARGHWILGGGGRQPSAVGGGEERTLTLQLGLDFLKTLSRKTKRERMLKVMAKKKARLAAVPPLVKYKA